MEIIPAIDLVGGKCVRLYQGDYAKETCYGDPLSIAKGYEEAGIKRLHLVDLDGAKGDGIVNLSVLRSITEQTSLVVDFGGGIKSREQLERAFDSGASMVTCGSIAVKDKDAVLSWGDVFGRERLIIGCDASDGFVATNGWKTVTRTTVSDLVGFYWNKGFKRYICTDIAKDGTMTGPSFGLYQTLMKSFSGICLVASGGVSSMDDLVRLETEGLSGAIVGKALLEGSITVRQLADWGR